MCACAYACAMLVHVNVHCDQDRKYVAGIDTCAHAPPCVKTQTQTFVPDSNVYRFQTSDNFTHTQVNNSAFPNVGLAPNSILHSCLHIDFHHWLCIQSLHYLSSASLQTLFTFHCFHPFPFLALLYSVTLPCIHASDKRPHSLTLYSSNHQSKGQTDVKPVITPGLHMIQN